jgi:hypothetical protein
MTGWREAHHTKPQGIVDNQHIYFSLGATAAGGNNPLSTAIFIFSIARFIKKERLSHRFSTTQVTSSFSKFLDKHLTSKRMRGVAYGISALAALLTIMYTSATAATLLYILAYSLLMLANFSFDKEKNKVIGHDLRMAIGQNKFHWAAKNFI